MDTHCQDKSGFKTCGSEWAAPLCTMLGAVISLLFDDLLRFRQKLCCYVSPTAAAKLKDDAVNTMTKSSRCGFT
eukprot:4927695-Amphidinium_carterae.1